MAQGFGDYTGSSSRKRKFGSINLEASSSATPLKITERSLLEDLPQHILIKVLREVDHEDLNQLYLVSRTIREAALIANEWHFGYVTPKKKQKALDENEMPEIEAPNAPVKKLKSRLSGKEKAARDCDWTTLQEM